MALKTRYSPLQHFTFQNLFGSFGDLSPRNKMIALGVVGLALVLILFLPVSMLSGKIKSLQKEIAAARKGYTQVSDKIAEYQKVRARIQSVEEKFGPTSGSLTTRIDAIAKQSEVTVDSLKEKAPTESDYMEVNSIDVRFSNIALPSLIEFLYNLENDKSSPMRIRRIQIKPKTNNRQVMDVTCEVASFNLKKEG